MNEHLFQELVAVSPQHERRVIRLGADSRSNDDLLVYCTICVFYQRGTLLKTMGQWAEHLEKVVGGVR